MNHEDSPKRREHSRRRTRPPDGHESSRCPKSDLEPSPTPARQVPDHAVNLAAVRAYSTGNEGTRCATGPERTGPRAASCRGWAGKAKAARSAPSDGPPAARDGSSPRRSAPGGPRAWLSGRWMLPGIRWSVADAPPVRHPARDAIHQGAALKPPSGRWSGSDPSSLPGARWGGTVSLLPQENCVPRLRGSAASKVRDPVSSGVS